MTSEYPNKKTISIRQNGFFNKVVTNIYLNHPNDPSKKVEGKALWDTGATFTSIRKDIAEDLKLGLITARNVSVKQATKGSEIPCPIKNVDINLSNKISLLKYKVGCLDIAGNYIAIIGMDIIGSGSFSTHYDPSTKQSIFNFSINPEIGMLRNFRSKIELE